MVEQLYHTFSAVGLEKKTGGVQIRAASEGLSDTSSPRVRALAGLCVYELPKGIVPYRAHPEDSPICLLFMRIGNERVLAQKVYAGVDANNRPGNHFVHLLAGLPLSFPAREAIECWAAPFWKRNANNLKSDVVRLEQLSLKHGPPGIGNQALDLCRTAVKENLARAIQGYLLLGSNDRLFIAGESEDVAALIWGITRALPKKMIEDLTFSTFEREPDKADRSLRIVGTFWQGTSYDLPNECYQGYGIGINCLTGRCSPVLDQEKEKDSPQARYARLAAASLLGDPAPLNAILKPAEQIGVADFGGLGKLFETVTRDPNDEISEGQLDFGLQYPALAALLLKQPGVRTSFVKQLTSKPTWWTETGKSAVEHLQSAARSDLELGKAILALADKLLEYIQALLKVPSPDLYMCQWLLDQVVTILAGSKEQAFGALVKRFAPEWGGANAWQYKRLDIRMWMLREWKHIQPKDQDALAALRSLLNVSWQDLRELLALELPEDYEREAIRNCIVRDPQQDPVSSDVAHLADEHYALFEPVLLEMASYPQAHTLVVRFFGTLVDGFYVRKWTLLDALLAKITPKDPAYDHLLSAAQLDGYGLQFLMDKRGGPRLLYELWLRPNGHEYLDIYLQGLTYATAHIRIKRIDTLLEYASAHPLDPAAPLVDTVVQYLAERKDWEDIQLLLDERGSCQFLYECAQDPTRKSLFSTYLEGLSGCADPFRKAALIRKLLEQTPRDPVFAEDVLTRIRFTSDDTEALYKDNSSFAFRFKDSAAARQLTGKYIDILNRRLFSKVEPLVRLFTAATQEDRAFTDSLLKQVTFDTFGEIRQFIYGSPGVSGGASLRFLYERRHQEPCQQWLETYARGLTTTYRSDMLAGLNDLLKIGKEDPKFVEMVLAKVHLSDWDNIRDVLLQQSIGLLYGLTDGSERKRLLETLMLGMPLDKARIPANEILLKDIADNRLKITREGWLEVHLTLYLESAGWNAETGVPDSYRAMVKQLPAPHRENIEGKLAEWERAHPPKEKPKPQPESGPVSVANQLQQSEAESNNPTEEQKPPEVIKDGTATGAKLFNNGRIGTNPPSEHTTSPTPSTTAGGGASVVSLVSKPRWWSRAGRVGIRVWQVVMGGAVAVSTAVAMFITAVLLVCVCGLMFVGLRIFISNSNGSGIPTQLPAHPTGFVQEYATAAPMTQLEPTPSPMRTQPELPSNMPTVPTPSPGSRPPAVSSRTLTPTPTSTATRTATSTATATATRSPSSTPTNTGTPTRTATPSSTPSPTLPPTLKPKILVGSTSTVPFHAGTRVDTTAVFIDSDPIHFLFQRPPNNFGQISSAVWSADGKRVLLAFGFTGSVADPKAQPYTYKSPWTGIGIWSGGDTPQKWLTGNNLANEIQEGQQYELYRDAIWSSDGTKIAVLTTNPAANYQTCIYLLTLDNAGSTVIDMRPFAACSINDHPRYWSEDGKWVLAWSDTEGELGKLYAYSTDPQLSANSRVESKPDMFRVYDERYFPWKLIDNPVCHAPSFWQCE